MANKSNRRAWRFIYPDGSKYVTNDRADAVRLLANSFRLAVPHTSLCEFEQVRGKWVSMPLSITGAADQLRADLQAYQA